MLRLAELAVLLAGNFQEPVERVGSPMIIIKVDDEV